MATTNKQNEKSHKKRILNPYMAKLLQSVASMTVCLVIIICAVFAWFQKNNTVTTTGANITVLNLKTLKVAATAGGPDISTLSVPQNLLIANVKNDEVELYPASSGDFTVYITASGASGDTILKFTPTIYAGMVDKYGNAVEDYRPGTFTTEEKAEAINYVNGHVLLFLNYENGVYSNWVDPYGTTPITVTGGVETPVKFYWVWVYAYYKLCDGSDLISTADITKIRSYYFGESGYTEKAGTYLFDTRTAALNPNATLSQLGHYYDFADGDIGSIVSHIFFRLAVSA